MLQNELSFYYWDTKDGMYILFMKVSWNKDCLMFSLW
jgi:hypothetical protein